MASPAPETGVTGRQERWRHWSQILLLALLAASAPRGAAAAAPSRALRASAPPVKKFDWHVTVGVAGPDCFEKNVILVNGELSPTLEVTQGDVLELTLYNDLPADRPDVMQGLTLHWHGFDMKGVPWYDGAAYASLCPVQTGKSFTYRFQVNEPPGTYIWHGHSGAARVDGLAGPLIVHPRPGTTPPGAPEYNEERIIFLGDLYHAEAAALVMPLNRPFDAERQSNETGGWAWANNPQALLINGRGNYLDCNLNAGGVTSPNVTCDVKNYWVPPGASAVQPWASATNPGCAHTNVTVEAGKTYLLRIVSATTLTLQTICFEGHDVTIVSADASPVETIKASALGGCIDVNSGQRYDVLLRANQPAGNYWISTRVQYRNGSPAGYAVLQYKGAKPGLPKTPAPQPGAVAPWTTQQAAKIVMSSAVLGKTFTKEQEEALYPGAARKVPAATLDLRINITQPLMHQTGQLRWALNNVAGQVPAPCTPLLDLLYEDPGWIEEHVVPAGAANSPDFEATALGKQRGTSAKVDVFLTTADGSAAPVYPTAGTHLLPLKRGEVVQLVLQNLPANANNGDYREPAGTSRNATEQHPFHLHGHHFWELGSGLGVYDPATHGRTLNTRNPPLRDTATLPMSGWVVLRFKADNPGVWPFHCHLMFHEYMGQLLHLAEAVDELPERPKRLPACPNTCTYNAAPWKPAFVEQQWGDSGFETPLP